VNPLCRPVIGNRTFIIATNLTELDTYVGKTFRSLIYVQSQGCRESIVNFACGIYYPLCDSSGLHCPCHSTTGKLTKKCEEDVYGSFLATFAVSLLHNLTEDGRPCGNLSHTGPGLGKCFSPEGSTGAIQCPPEMVDPTVPGSRPLLITAASGPTWPLGANGWAGGDLEVCKLPCYASFFSEEEEQASVTIVTTLAWISTVCCLLLFVIFRRSNDKSWPGRLQVYFTVCVFFLSLSLTFASMIGFSESMWCENQSLCTIQALLLEYFALALAMWWLLICFNIFLAIVVYHKDDSAHTSQHISDATESWEKFYHSVAWGVPALFTAILSLNGKLGYPVYGNPSYCWITDEDSSVWEFTFYYAEILAIVVVGLLFFFTSIFKLRRLLKGSFGFWKLLRSIAVTVCFILSFAFTFTFMGIYQISLTIQEDVDRAAYNEYMQCIVSRWWRTAFTHIPPVECVRKTHPDLVVMDIQSSCFASLGIVTFLVFGSPHFQSMGLEFKRWVLPPPHCNRNDSHRSTTVKDDENEDSRTNLINNGHGGAGGIVHPQAGSMGNGTSMVYPHMMQEGHPSADGSPQLQPQGDHHNLEPC